MASIARVERKCPVPVMSYVTDGEALALVTDWLPKSDEIRMEDAMTGNSFFCTTESFQACGWKVVAMSKECSDG